MFSEFLEAVEDDEGIGGIDVEKLVRERVKAEIFDEAQDAFGTGRINQALTARVDCGERYVNGNGIAVTNLVIGDLFELARGPMPEIERTRGAEFEGIAGGRNVINVQFGAA